MITIYHSTGYSCTGSFVACRVRCSAQQQLFWDTFVFFTFSNASFDLCTCSSSSDHKSSRQKDSRAGRGILSWVCCNGNATTVVCVLQGASCCQDCSPL